MRITIVGAGPVGLLLACLLAREHNVTLLDKRTSTTRDHGLNIDSETIQNINEYISNDTNLYMSLLRRLMESWSGISVATSEIQSHLSEIAIAMGVDIRRGIAVESLADINSSVIIGADGAHSKIRELVFNNETTDRHDVQYMASGFWPSAEFNEAQLKYKTPGATRRRLPISAMSYSFLNGLSGSDMVLDFESLAPANEELRKPGTLHIPIPDSVYEILSANNRGNYNHPWIRATGPNLGLALLVLDISRTTIY